MPSSEKTRLTSIRRVLAKRYPTPETPLHFTQLHELLIAVMLSAQTTDILVNKVTSALFARYPRIADFATAETTELDALIARVNYHHTKARHIIETARLIEAEFNGNVPDTMEGLLRLPGVARKTANVVLSEGFNEPVGIVVDTHVARVSFRLGLTTHTDPVKIEKDLLVIVPKKEWRSFPLRLIFHGREICIARRPMCSLCPLAKHCPKNGVTDAR